MFDGNTYQIKSHVFHDAEAAKNADALAVWKARREYLEEKRAVLEIYYGKLPEGEAELKYENFAESLGLILENASGRKWTRISAARYFLRRARRRPAGRWRR